MQDILQNSKHLSEYDKEIFCAMFKRLDERQNILFQNIEKNVEKQMFRIRNIDNNWRIITAIINKSEVDEAKKNGLYEIIKISPFKQYVKFDDLEIHQNSMLTKDVYCAGIAFLRCAYHEVADIIDKKYIARVMGKEGEYDVEYYLRPYMAYYDYEELLERTARQYGVERPTLFSPQSRRAVSVSVDFGDYKVSKSDSLVIDFKLKENNLLDRLQIEKTLVWNVEIIDEHEIPQPKENTNKQVVPLFNNEYQIYEFSVEENEFIYIKTRIGDIKRFNNCVYINLSENQYLDDVRYWKIRINDCTKAYVDKIDYKYWNFYKLNRIYKERIRTEADIEYVFGFFENELTSCLGIMRTLGENRAIRTYENRDAYRYSKNKNFRSSAICYVKFEKSENWLFEDYISYIFAFMNYYYPEFYWVGVV